MVPDEKKKGISVWRAASQGLLGYWANWANWVYLRLQPLIAPPACVLHYSLRKKNLSGVDSPTILVGDPLWSGAPRSICGVDSAVTARAVRWLN